MNRLVVGYDGSPPSLAALMWANDIAERARVPVHLIRVVDDEWGMVGAEYAHEREHAAAVSLSAAGSSVRAIGGVTTELRHGSTATELAHALAPDDLLILGSHKAGYTRGRALGSLSVRLAPVVPCSLLVIPGAPAIPGRTGIVLGVGPIPSPASIATAVDQANAAGQSLLLLASAPADRRAAAERALAQAAEWATAHTTHAVTRRITTKPAAEALLEASRGAHLLVLGASSAPGGGSTTHDVLMNPLTAVWIAR